jgi:hypothetical protein
MHNGSLRAYLKSVAWLGVEVGAGAGVGHVRIQGVGVEVGWELSGDAEWAEGETR